MKKLIIALSSIVISILVIYLMMEDGPATEEEWKSMFVQSLACKIESRSELQVHILEADMQKGILSAEAILIYRHPTGESGSVTTGQRTIILEEYESD